MFACADNERAISQVLCTVIILPLVMSFMTEIVRTEIKCWLYVCCAFEVTIRMNIRNQLNTRAETMNTGLSNAAVKQAWIYAVRHYPVFIT